MKKFIPVLFVSAVLCSCLSPWSSCRKKISHCEIMRDYVGVPLKLQRDIGIIKEPGIKYLHLVDLSDPLYEITKRQKANNITDSYIGALGKGTPLLIDAFRVERIYAGPIIIVAVGKIMTPGNEELQDFEYTWSYTWELARAPWDDESVPEKRILKLSEEYECM